MKNALALGAFVSSYIMYIYDIFFNLILKRFLIREQGLNPWNTS